MFHKNEVRKVEVPLEDNKEKSQEEMVKEAVEEAKKTAEAD